MRLLRWLGGLLVGCSLLLAGIVRAAPVPVAPVLVPLIGPIVGITLDSAGNGWAWTDRALLRVENGTWQSSYPPLSPRLVIARVVVTAQGQEGWAIGNLETPGGGWAPRLLRWRQGLWQVVSAGIPADGAMTDLALSADGRSGWISLINPAQALSLHDGRWVPVAPPDPGGFYNLAISPNGRLGWAVGPSAAGYTLYRLAGQRWLAVAPVWLPPEPLLPERLATIRLTADDAGNGWLLANDAGDSGVGSGVPRLLLMRLRANQPPQPLTVTLPSAPGAVVSLEDLTVDNSGRGWLAGRTLQPIPPKTPYTLRPLVLLRVTGEVLTEVDPASTGAPPGLGSSNRLASNGDGTHTWLATSTSIFQFGALTELDEAWPHAAPAAAPPLAGAGQCFTRVPHCLRGVFARYWLAHGGLEQFGFPLTPEVWEAPAGKHLLVQYTERARLEYHPENRPPYDVQLGLLGNAVADIRAHEIPFQPAVAHGGPGFQWSPATQHNIGPPFLAYWQSHGGVPVFGLPRSEAFDEQSATDGKVYRVQYFERVRLEYHPENMGTRYEFLRGLLGVDWFKQTYGYTP